MEEKILKYVQGIAEKKGEHITAETDLFDGGILDSLEIITLLTYLQNEFHVVFTPDDLQFENYQTVKKIVEWVTGHIV